MKHKIAIAFLSLILVSLTFGMINQTYAQPPSLRSIFNPPTCQRACWLGIEPGVTTQTQLQTILATLDIAYEVKNELGVGDIPANRPYGWLPDEHLAFIHTKGGKSEVRIYFSQGIVRGIRLPVNIPVSMITSEYGAPIQVRHLEDSSFELIYPALGLNFFVSKDAGVDHATVVRLFSWAGTLQNVESSDSPYLLSDCSQFSNPCSIATATPPPTLSAVPTLREVFNPSTCQRACWLGIEPGVTTQSQLQGILANLGISYEVKNELGVGLNPANRPYGWLVDDYDYLPFIDNQLGESQVRVYFTEGMVQGIRLPVNIPVSMITSEYGAPIQVRHLSGTGFEVIYPSLGMNFYISSYEGKDHATLLNLFSEVGALQNVEPSDSPYLLSDCSLFNNPCNIVTATPTPLAPTTAKPTPQIPTLRQVFNTSGCVVSCWEGIQPGETRQGQLEFLLKHRTIDYERTQTNDVEFLYTWIPENLPFIDTRSAVYHVTVTVVNEVVVNIKLPVNIPLEKMVQAYGAPTIAIESVATTSARYTTVVYPTFGLEFEVSSQYGLQSVWQVNVTGKSDLLMFFTGLPNAVQDCSLYSSPDCVLATATTTP